MADVSVGLFITAIGGTQPEASGSLPLSAFGSNGNGQIAGLPFYAEGIESPLQAGLPLFARGSDDLWESAGLPIFGHGAYPSVDGGLPLTAIGWHDPSCPTLWQLWNGNWETHTSPLWGCTPAGGAFLANAFPIYAAGAETGEKDSTLNIFVRRGAGAGLPLTAYGPGFPSSSGLTLFASGSLFFSRGLPLYASGVGASQGGLALYGNGF
jgi:hypothetical protein